MHPFSEATFWESQYKSFRSCASRL